MTLVLIAAALVALIGLAFVVLPPASTKGRRPTVSSITLADVRRLDVMPGDTIVLTAPNHLSREAAEHIRDYVRECFPDARCMVISGGMSITVVGADELTPAK